MLYPLLAMVAFTFLLLISGFIMRYRAVSRGEVSMGYFRLVSGDAPRYLQQATRHFSNLFEMPMLFYVAALIYLLHPIEAGWVAPLAWAYVLSRIAHAAIHLTYNNVIHRMLVFQVSNLALIALWVGVALNF
ncbi:MAG: MAPEG family protein [Natronospirillum sp.]|uniref:MAPEG family protein n=1 Tax=Natronospirillum sp. TaxID=2812955 RepID=UPI0025CCD3D7|nr:MAPEG family protein [Natronospirillum sp.]MCH8551649.1 MAPEG family protein [Natronospirillum sp.]